MGNLDGPDDDFERGNDPNFQLPDSDGNTYPQEDYAGFQNPGPDADPNQARKLEEFLKNTPSVAGPEFIKGTIENDEMTKQVENDNKILRENARLLEASVHDLIECLRQTSAFDASEYVKRLSSIMYGHNLAPYAVYQPLPPYKLDESRQYFNYFKHFGTKAGLSEWDDRVRKLAAGTLGLAFRRNQDSYGFHDSVDENKAFALSTGSLVETCPFFIEAHIDSALTKKGLKNLAEYCRDESFTAAYKRVICDNTLQQDLVVADLQPSSKTFRSSLLYVLEYFLEGDVPYVRSQLTSGSTSHNLANVVDTWLRTCQSGKEQKTYAEAFNQLIADPNGIKDKSQLAIDVAQSIIPLDIVYLPNMDIGSNVAVYVENTLTTIRPELKGHIKSLLTAIPNDLLTFCTQVKTFWNSEIGVLGDKVKSSLSDSIDEEKKEGELMKGRDGEFRGDNNDVLMDVTYKYHKHAYIAASLQENLRDVDVWKAVNMGGHNVLPCDEKWWGDGGNRRIDRSKEREEVSKPDFGCFKSGTTVWTNAGERFIQDLQENDKVLTRATTGEYGLCSDEKVMHRIDEGRCLLYGFNQEEPFFSANHVFVTTTGLRAVNPHAAKLENPWLDVGNLRKGHILLNTNDGITYNHKVIEEITSSVVECGFLYGVHLREGLRNYHANGYLVRLNYPEITIKSIAKMLKTFPPDVRSKMLRSMEELRPLFDRFGKGTVDLVLQNEIFSSDIALSQMNFKAPTDFGPLPLYFQHRGFDLEPGSKVEDQKYTLPYIDALDGVLCVQGQRCPRAVIVERGFQWSRQLEDSLWEHGICSFGNDIHLLTGEGAVWLEAEALPVKLTSEPIRFQAHAVMARQYEENDEVLVSATGELSFRVTDVSAEDQDEQEFADKLNGLPTPTTKSSEENLTKQTNAAMGSPTPIDVDITVNPVFTFDLSYEVGDFADKTPDKTTLSWGQLQLVTTTTTGGIKSLAVAVPALDDISAKLRLDSNVAPKIYDVVVASLPNNDIVFAVDILHPEQLALLADDNTEPITRRPRSFKDLKFTNLKSTYKLPFIFSTMTGLIKANHTVAGLIAEFDPAMDADQGTRHSLLGAIGGLPVPPPLASTDHGGSTTGGGLPSLPNLSPSKSVDKLCNNLSVDTGILKEFTQKLIQTTMRYHMDDKQRMAMGFQKPQADDTASTNDTVPHSLADQLHADTAKWIRDSYANAYIAQNLAMIPDSQLKDAHITYTAKDIKRLHYYWTGTGTQCLSQSPIYNQLNTEASIVAFRTLYPVIDTYIKDTSPPIIGTDANAETSKQEYASLRGSKKWANLMYDKLVATEIPRLANNSKVVNFTNLNDLEVKCTILNTLDPEGGFGKKLSEAVQRYLRENNLFKYRSIADGTDMENGMRDYLLALYELLLDPQKAREAGIEVDFQKEWARQMGELAEWGTDMLQKTKKELAAKLLEATSGAIKEVSSLCAGLTELPKNALVTEGKKGMARLFGAIKQKMSANTPAKAKVSGALCFSLSLAGTVYFIYESWGAWGEVVSPNSKHPFSTTDITRLVANSITAFGGIILTTLSAVKLWRGAHLPNPARGVDTAAVAEAHVVEAEQQIARRASAIHPDNAEQPPDKPTIRRRNAIMIKNLAPAGRGPINIMMLFVSSQKKVSWKDRAKNWFSDKGKNFGEGWAEAKSRVKQNITMTAITGVMAAASVVLLVLACIEAAELFRNPDATAGQKAVAVLSLVVQFIGVVLEIVAIFRVVPGWISIAVIVVGLFLNWLAGKLAKEPKPPPTPLEEWWTGQGKSFIDKLPNPPGSRLSWSVDNAKVKPGDETTITVKGLQTNTVPMTGVDPEMKTLARIEVNFTAAPNSATSNGSAALFEVAASEIFELTTDAPTSKNKCKISYGGPAVNQTWPGVTKDPSVLMQRYSAVVDLRERSRMEPPIAAGVDLPSIDIGAHQEVWFAIRGKIAVRGIDPGKDKEVGGMDGQVPIWKRYEMLIKESYCNQFGELTHVTETIIQLEKIA